VLSHGLIISFVFSGQSVLFASTWTEICSSDIGMPVSAVTTIHQDQYGNVWMGNQEGGIAVFDGVHWKVYREPDQDGDVNSIATDSKGGIWAGINGHLWKFTEGSWYQFQRKGSEVIEEFSCWFDYFFRTFKGIPFIPGEIADLEVDNQNNLWILLQPRGIPIVRFNETELMCWEDEEWPSFHRLLQVKLLPQERIWITGLTGTSPGLWIAEYDDGEWNQVVEGFFIGFISVASNGIVWATGWDDGDKVFTYENGIWEEVFELHEPSNGAHGLVADNLGGAWMVLTDNLGENPLFLHLDSRGKVIWYPYPHNRAFNRFVRPQLLVDDQNRLWLGESEGLFFLDKVSTELQRSTWASIKARPR